MNEEPTTESPFEGDSKLIDLLKRKHSTLGDRIHDTKMFSVPGYDDLLAINCKRCEWKTVRQSVRNIKPTAEMADLMYATRLVLTVQDGVYGRASVEQDWTQLDSIIGEALADRLGLDKGSAETVLRSLFGQNDFALIAFSNELQEWLSNSNAEALENFMGE